MSHEIRPGGNGTLAGLGDLRGPAIKPDPLPAGHPDGGMGDYVEPFARHIEPGGRRPMPPKPIEAYVPPIPGTPGMPGDGVVAINPAMLETLIEAQLRALAIIKEREGAIPTIEERMHTATAEAFTVGTTAVQLDAITRRERRAVMLTNTSLVNTVWYGFSATVGINNGGYLAPGGGTASLPIDENVQVWTIATAAGTVVSILQFA